MVDKRVGGVFAILKTASNPVGMEFSVSEMTPKRVVGAFGHSRCLEMRHG